MGFWDGVEDLRKHWAEARRWLPSAEDGARTRGYELWKKAVERSLGWVEE